MSNKLTNVDLENIYLALNKEIYIDELINWLEQRKRTGYSKIKPETTDKVITLITIR